MMIRTVIATRYVAPLREGGSLPAVVEADDGKLYVLKFRGAGQGVKALIAELVAGEIARTLGLLVPEIVFVELDPTLSRSEPDVEIQELIKKSAGLNLALAYLPHAITYAPCLMPTLSPEVASAIVWFDAYVTNVDRTRSNTNMMMSRKQLWLIDHGATLYFHHAWTKSVHLTRSRDRFPYIKEHVLLPFATTLAEVDATLSALLTQEVIQRIVTLIPDDWLDETIFTNLDEHRAAYAAYLLNRLKAPHSFVEEALQHVHALV